MAVVVQAGFGIVILALEAQRVVDYRHVLPKHVAVGAVDGGPDQLALGIRHFLGCAQVVELVVVDGALFRAVAVRQGQRAEAVRFVQVSPVAVALPDEFGALVVAFLDDAAAEGVVFVAEAEPVGAGDFHQPVFAVVAVSGDQLLTLTAPFGDQVAEVVVLVVVVSGRRWQFR